MVEAYAETVTGTMNFAADRNDGGEFSNTFPERSRQDLLPRNVDIRNGRSCLVAPSLANEGVMITGHPSGKADWSNSEWIETEYVPSCVELVKQLSGAKHAVSVYASLQRRVDFGEHEGAAPTAGFVHIDQTREAAMQMGGALAEAQGVTFKRAAIFNVWKCMTPSPQDYPLAVSDMRSIPVEDHVPGTTVEFIGEEEERLESPYIVVAPSERPVFYYYPDMTPEESLVFVGVDLDPSKPLGCAHSAFRHPAPSGPTEPRASIETRVLAIFE